MTDQVFLERVKLLQKEVVLLRYQAERVATHMVAAALEEVDGIITAVILYLEDIPAAPMNGEVAALLRQAITTDGDHHKQWYLEQIALLLHVSLPEHTEGIP